MVSFFPFLAPSLPLFLHSGSASIFLWHSDVGVLLDFSINNAFSRFPLQSFSCALLLSRLIFTLELLLELLCDDRPPMFPLDISSVVVEIFREAVFSLHSFPSQW